MRSRSTRSERRRPQLKPLAEQTIVITGATSGIGLATARKAAARGANLVLAARNEEALQKLCNDLSSTGVAVGVRVDVGKEEDLAQVRDAALKQFGGFDTWINNAGVSIYGNLVDISLEDQRRLFDTNFWGVVHGCRLAAEHLSKRGGAIINLGSVASDRAIPVQGIYSASKHAVKGYTDALRVELEASGAPVSVTLIKPAAIDTPYVKHAKNYLDVEPRNIPPYYAPDVVADAILDAAEHPRRDVFVGGASAAMSIMGRSAQRTTDRVMEHMAIRSQRTNEPARPRKDALHEPGDGLSERGDYTGHVAKSSLYTEAMRHPKVSGALLLTTGLLARNLWRGRHR